MSTFYGSKTLYHISGNNTDVSNKDYTGSISFNSIRRINNGNMESADILWMFCFTLALAILNFLYGLIFKYVDDKPMGSQSIFDLVMKDHFNNARDQCYKTNWVLVSYTLPPPPGPLSQYYKPFTRKN